MGRRLIAIHDVDGDGCGDVVLDAPSDLLPGDPRVGRAYVFSGTTGKLIRELARPTLEEVEEGFAEVVSGLGDLDADGVDEIAVSAHTAAGASGVIAAGAVYVFSGRTGNLLQVLRSPHETFGGNFGISGAINVGDVTGDGVPDAGIGAVFDSEGGRAYVCDVTSNTVVHELYASSGVHFGAAVGAAGDMTGDMIPDVLVLASRERIGSTNQPRGVTYLFSGADGLLVRRMPGVRGDIVSISDVNGDGVRDIACGVPSATPPGGDTEDGVVYIVSGATGEFLRTLAGPTPQETESFGASVEVSADINADGVEDLVIGDMHATVPGGPRFAGAVYVYSGLDGSMLRRILSPRPVENGGFGAGVAVVPDANHDGRPDIAVGAPFEQLGGGPRQAYIFHSCAADFDGSGTVDSADFFLFLQRFFANAAPADFNRDGAINSGDFFDFLSMFFAGCG
jgi:hypothetical protein